MRPRASNAFIAWTGYGVPPTLGRHLGIDRECAGHHREPDERGDRHVAQRPEPEEQERDGHHEVTPTHAVRCPRDHDHEHCDPEQERLAPHGVEVGRHPLDHVLERVPSAHQLDREEHQRRPVRVQEGHRERDGTAHEQLALAPLPRSRSVEPAPDQVEAEVQEAERERAVHVGPQPEQHRQRDDGVSTDPAVGHLDDPEEDHEEEHTEQQRALRPQRVETAQGRDRDQRGADPVATQAVRAGTPGP